MSKSDKQHKEVITTSYEALSKRMDEQGVGYEIVELEEKQPDGSIIKKKTIMVNKVPPMLMDVAKFFDVANVPCWFKGCEELRERYVEALNGIGGASCTGCAKGRLIRQFTPLVQQLLKSSEAAGRDILYQKLAQDPETYNEESIPTRTIQVPGSGSSSAKGTSTWKALLRRATTGIKKIFRIGA